jgi:hypothetical protein
VHKNRWRQRHETVLPPNRQLLHVDQPIARFTLSYRRLRVLLQVRTANEEPRHGAHPGLGHDRQCREIFACVFMERGANG